MKKFSANLISKETYCKFLSELVNKIFKILPLYEEAEKVNNFDNYYIYIDKLIIMLKGCEDLLLDTNFFELISILEGMRQISDLTQRKTKSLVFHCIDIVNKIKEKN